MGIIRAIGGGVGGTLADTWLEAVEADNMDNSVLMTEGVLVRRDDKRTQNKKYTDGIITDGSIIHVAENQFMVLVDGGKIIDYSAEPGYYKVDNKSAPSLFNGQFKDALKDVFDRIRFSGTPRYKQQVFYINLQEIRDIPFGTPNPINYFDNFYNVELYVRAHGYYSVRIIHPVKFYMEMVSRDVGFMTIDILRKIYLAEFLTAFQTAIGQMSVNGDRVSYLPSKTMELTRFLDDILDEEWEQRRGIRIESVGISSLSYDEASKKIIDMRNQGAILSDGRVREGYVQGAVARGIEAAGSNSGGAMEGFLGLGLGTQAAGSVIQAASASNQAAAQTLPAGAVPAAPAQPQAAPAGSAFTGWTCSECGQTTTGSFCFNCGTKKVERACSECKQPLIVPNAKFCSNCGAKLSE